jgi:pyrroloquinoline quinone (PQQ) biosynthesis protein C
MTSEASWELIHRGSPEAFVAALKVELRGHPAVHHPYLVRLAKGDVPDPRRALWDYANQYAHYSELFASYVEAVMDNLDEPRFRAAIESNLIEEQGDAKATDPTQLPHRMLFQDFRNAARPPGVEDSPPCRTVLIWRELFLQKCQSPQRGLGLGGIGLGTESIVPTVYGYLLEAIRNHTDLTERDYLFFEMHSEVDHEHSAVMEEISIEVCSDSETREALRFGAISALNLRATFWDTMLGQACALPPATAT